MINDIKKFVDTFFDKLLIEINNIDITLNKKDVYIIKLDTPNSEILIWTYGKTFEAIQDILRNTLSHKFDKKIMLQLEINNYVHNKDSKLFSLVDKEIKHAKEVWRNMKLPVLNWYERKKVHWYISELNDSEIRTESIWEWKERRLFIMLNSIESKPNYNNNNNNNKEIKHKKLEIDIDWNDI